MVFTNKYSETLIGSIKNFKDSDSLAEAMDIYDNNGKISISAIFNGLTNFVLDELIPSSELITNQEIEIYNLIEDIRATYSSYQKGTEEFDYDNAACTCFLENLLNAAGYKNINYDRFIPYLGVLSKEYCKAWDKFTGVRSLGLWTDQEWNEANQQ